MALLGLLALLLLGAAPLRVIILQKLVALDKRRLEQADDNRLYRSRMMNCPSHMCAIFWHSLQLRNCDDWKMGGSVTCVLISNSTISECGASCLQLCVLVIEHILPPLEIRLFALELCRMCHHGETQE